MKNKTAPRLALVVGVCTVALVTLCVLTGLTYVNFQRLGEANRWNVHTYQVLDEIAVLRATLSEEESQLRGFALTGDPAFLRAAPREERTGLQALGALRQLTSDRAEQQRRLDKFALSYEKWRLDAAALQRESALASAARIKSQTASRRGDLVALEQQLREVESTERFLLAARTREQRASQNLAAQSLFWASLATVLLSLLSTLWLALQARSLENSNAQLSQSEEQLRTVLDNAPVVLYRVDLSERYVLLAGKALSRLKIDGQTSIGRTMPEVMGPDYDMEPVRAALRGEPSVELAPVGDSTFEVHRQPLRDESGAITGMIGVAVDVSARQKAETALRESEARFHAFMDNSPMMAFIKDAAGRMIYVNGPMLRRFEKTEAEMIGKDDFDLWPPDVARTLAAHDQMVLAGEEVVVTEESVPTPDGAVPTWLSFKFPLRDASGRKLVGGVSIDISDRKIAEETLRATSILQRAILDGAPYSIIAASPDGMVQSFNRAAEQLLGYEAGEVCGIHRVDIFHDPQELAARAAQIGEEVGRPLASDLESLLFKPRASMIEEREWTYLRRDGSSVPVRLSVSALYGADGEISGYVGIGYDLTESRRAERVKNEFVSVVSHELRTPLTSIRGALGLLAGGVAGELPSGAKQMIDIAQKNSDRLVLLINDILDIEKIESGKMRFDVRPLALRELLESAVVQNGEYAQTLGVHLEIESASDLNSIQVLGDESRLQQVLSNLLSNACKFSPSGGVVTIRAHILVDAMVQIRVCDQGPGVPIEFVPRLFEKFAQADSSATRKQGGTGLGLPIARAIVEKHGGTLGYIEPQNSGQGATFAFDLPLVRAEVSDQIEARVAPPESEILPRVLICEDNAETADLLSLMVRQSGFRPEIAATLQEARALLGLGSTLDSTKNQAPANSANADFTTVEAFAGITLDLLLPDGNGADLIDELRAAGRDLPVIVVSASIEAGRLCGEALPILDWLAKPLDSARLQAALRRFRGADVPRLLHVEDDADVRRIVAAILGKDADIVAAPTLRAAQGLLQTQHFDLAILDVSLPDGNGLDLIAQLNRSEPPTPIILFSASETPGEQLQGVAASLVKSRTENETLRSTIRRFLSDGAT